MTAPASATEAQARTLAGYDRASALRQVHDRDWVLGGIGGEPAVLFDLGCGIGQLLQEALERFPSLRLAVGLERSEHRIAEAGERLAAHGPRVRLHPADLTEPPALPERADVVTMTSVLHWLHPYEERIFAWIAGRLAPGGRFLLTTYHPARDGDGFGGEDEIVREALAALGIAPAAVPGLFATHGVLPIAVRTRTPGGLEELLSRHFTVDSGAERAARVSVADARQYEHFHAATFGDYYARLVAPERRAEFFTAVGESAWRRQRERGRVSDMPVRLWRLAPRTDG
ncbi:class I SAM-dependent methyltransferase [Streptomyces yaizuensis]|uniref:Class I SAM-dependent methyltransferase n=1 Tax=Streptomyces yaizuensis TaxID=2989713 RepID=A0ABQ5NSQ3_9ACTN|nr:class I SAM-dependent methyltransferase [Streptomyces sp. YSPA8]GLF93036.1 class I SAM-dependent methyltransferase [Streptomyces sp. YSPA8]